MVLQWYSSSLWYGEICAELLTGILETGRARSGCQVASAGERADCRSTLCRAVPGDFRSGSYAEAGKPGGWRRSCIDLCL